MATKQADPPAVPTAQPTPQTRALHGGLRSPVAVKLEVASLGGYQLVVGALLGDSAVLEHDDPVGLADC